MKDHSNVQVQNRNTKSRGSAYTLSNGQRVPVLFRLTNVQMPKVTAKSADQQSEASIRIDSASPNITANLEKADAMSVSESATSNTQMVGPSWMRRNAYRVTVLALLIATVLLLNNNQGKATRPLEVASTGAGNTESLASSEKDVEPQSVETPEPKSDTQIASVEPIAAPSNTIAIDDNSVQPSTLTQQSTTGARPNTVVETTTTDSNTKFLITKEAESNSAEAPAVAQLLAPQTLDNNASAKDPVFAEKSEASTSIPAQPVSTGSVGAPKDTNTPSSLDSSDSRANTRINRYAGAPVQGVSAASDGNIPSTNAPPPDPSDLFAVFQQQSQIQPADETVRAAMRQTSNGMNPAWQAIPVSNTSSAPAGTGMNNMSTSTSPNTFAPTMQNNFGTSQQNGIQPQQTNINRSVTPVQTQYQPLFPQYGQSAGNLTGTELYTTPSMPVQNQQTTQPSPSATKPYQPVYPGLGSPNAQGMMGSQLFESADQSAGSY